MRSAIVTGASSGIGLAIARILAAEGYAITLAARDVDRLDAAAAELRDLGASVVTVPGNLVHEVAVSAVVSAHRAQFGELDVLVNNVGVGIGSPVEEISTKQLDLQLSLDLRAVVLFYREAAGSLRAAAELRGQALVLNLASMAGVHGQPWLSVYSAAKAGVIAFTQAMNSELAPARIKSCAICPGTVSTEMTSYLGGDRRWMISVDDVAEAARFLLRLSPACGVTQLLLENRLERPTTTATADG